MGDSRFEMPQVHMRAATRGVLLKSTFNNVKIVRSSVGREKEREREKKRAIVRNNSS